MTLSWYVRRSLERQNHRNIWKGFNDTATFIMSSSGAAVCQQIFHFGRMWSLVSVVLKPPQHQELIGLLSC